MENNLPQENQAPLETPKKGGKKLLILLGIILFALVVMIVLFMTLTKPKQKAQGNIAPLVDNIGNPQHVKVALSFSTLNLTTKNNEPVTVDLTLQTLEKEGVSGGKVVLKYDLQNTSDIKIAPVVGQTGILPAGTTFSDIKYNPGNIVFSFELPQGVQPITGNGRIAQVTFTPKVNVDIPKIQLSYDLPSSNIYLLSEGKQTKLKLSQAIMDITIEQ